MSVDFSRPEVKARQSAWKLVRDAVAGSEAVKRGDYVIPVNPHDESNQNKLRNDQRVNRAVYFNATGRTLPALVGIAFGKWPEVKLPASLDYLLDDADGSGVGLINLAQQVTADVLQTARSGLLVDYPSIEAGPSAADIRAGNARPTITMYPAESIINWRTIRRGARTILGMVVIAEQVEEWEDFERKTVDQRRVLLLGRLSEEPEGAKERYVVQIYRKNNGGEWVVHEEGVPRDANGAEWKEIPFTFIGAMNNDSTPDQPPLLDLAEMNIAHLRNSADHEESLFFAGQAQVWLTGESINEEQIELMQKEGMYVGSRAIGIAPGGVVMLQAQPVSALAEEMKHKVDLMARLGARMVAPGEAVRSATEAASDDKTNNSVLSLVCDNVSDAFRSALRWCARFAGVAESEVDFSIGTEFSGLQFDPQQLTAVIAAVQGGLMPVSEFYTYARNIGLIAADKSDDEVRDELEAGGGGLPLDEAA